MHKIFDPEDIFDYMFVQYIDPSKKKCQFRTPVPKVLNEGHSKNFHWWCLRPPLLCLQLRFPPAPCGKHQWAQISSS